MARKKYKVAARRKLLFNTWGKESVGAAMEGLERRWALGWTGAGTTPNPPLFSYLMYPLLF